MVRGLEVDGGIQVDGGTYVEGPGASFLEDIIDSNSFPGEEWVSSRGVLELSEDISMCDGKVICLRIETWSAEGLDTKKFQMCSKGIT